MSSSRRSFVTSSRPSHRKGAAGRGAPSQVTTVDELDDLDRTFANDVSRQHADVEAYPLDDETIESLPDYETGAQVWGDEFMRTLCEVPFGTTVNGKGVLSLEGRDSEQLLQGLLTNDMRVFTEATSGKERCSQLLYGALLNVKGRVLYDVFVYPTSTAHAYLLECDIDVVEDVHAYLEKHRLRAQVRIKDVTYQYVTWALMGKGIEEVLARSDVLPRAYCEAALKDPRAPQLGYRALMKNHHEAPLLEEDEVPGRLPRWEIAPPEMYDVVRYLHGVPEGVKEMEPGKANPLECNLHLLNGISFNKGCYVGQELTARTYHTGVIRKCLTPVMLKAADEPNASLVQDVQSELDLVLPPSLFGHSWLECVMSRPGDPVLHAETQRQVGRLVGSAHSVGLAMLRLEHSTAPNARFEVDDPVGATTYPLFPPIFQVAYGLGHIQHQDSLTPEST